MLRKNAVCNFFFFFFSSMPSRGFRVTVGKKLFLLFGHTYSAARDRESSLKSFPFVSRSTEWKTYVDWLFVAAPLLQLPLFSQPFLVAYFLRSFYRAICPTDAPFFIFHGKYYLGTTWNVVPFNSLPFVSPKLPLLLLPLQYHAYLRLRWW